jgi:alkylhydroperoxidase family enzyme
MTTAASRTRIKPLEPPYTPEVDEYLHKLMPPGMEPLTLFRILAVNFDLATRMRPLSAGILAHGKIAPRERELMILRTTALNGAEYEWGVHASIFKELTPEEIRDTALSSPGWTGTDALIIRLCEELHETSHVSDDLWAELKQHWPDAQLLEMVTIAGWYRTISYIINALQIELEPWAERLP